MRRSRERMIAEILAKCPHYIDIVPPRDGYSLVIETEDFRVSRSAHRHDGSLWCAD